jgi:mono/diheme cytochrome c family protein
MTRRSIVLALVFGIAACASTEIDEYPCPPGGTPLTYESFGKPFLDAHCQSCHGAGGTARKGAPSSYDFHDPGAAKHHRARIFARAAADNTTMPPGPDDPPVDERRKLAEWLACGAP